MWPAPTEGMILPGADSGLGTQLAAELSGQVSQLAAGPGSNSPVFSTARKCGDGERQQGPCPVASQRSASEKAPRDGGSHGGRGRFVAHEGRCSPRG